MIMSDKGLIVEDGVPMPDLHQGAGRPRIYPFADMKVGQSVFVDGGKLRGKEHGAARKHGQRHGKRFAVRTVDGGIRIWRVE